MTEIIHCYVQRLIQCDLRLKMGLLSPIAAFFRRNVNEIASIVHQENGSTNNDNKSQN